MSISKKHFEAVAKVIRKEQGRNQRPLIPMGKNKDTYLEGSQVLIQVAVAASLDRVAENLGREFAGFNPHFNIERFMDACCPEVKDV